MGFKHKGRLMGLFLAAVLCLGLFQPVPAAAADLYLTSLNETIRPLTASTMPMWSGGVLYVPYNTFDSNTTGVRLGMDCSYERSSNLVTLYNLQKVLVFDLNLGICYDALTNQTFSGRAITRNSQPYLPLGTVCDFFDLTYSYRSISQGYLVRIKSSAVVLSDEVFLEAAGGLINRRVQEYYQSIAPAPDTGPDTTPVTPTPTPDLDEEDEADISSTRVYLAFHCEESQAVGGLLDALDGRAYALFLLTPQVIQNNSDLIRRILGTGHSIGILAQGESLAQTQELLIQGAALLQQMAHVSATIACVPTGQRSALEMEGWVCWNETAFMEPSESTGASAFSTSVLRRLEGRGSRCYLTLSGNEDAARVLPTLLRQLEDNNFIPSVPLETRL